MSESGRLSHPHVCLVCALPVSLETTKTDEFGHVIHETCYMLKLKAIQQAKPSSSSAFEADPH